MGNIAFKIINDKYKFTFEDLLRKPIFDASSYIFFNCIKLVNCFYSDISNIPNGSSNNKVSDKSVWKMCNALFYLNLCLIRKPEQVFFQSACRTEHFQANKKQRTNEHAYLSELLDMSNRIATIIFEANKCDNKVTTKRHVERVIFRNHQQPPK